MNNVNKKEKWKAPKVCFIIFSIVMFIMFLQFAYLSLSKEVYGINMKEFAANRNTVTSVLTAKRGSIFDVEGNILAQNISSYTLIAYLDSARTLDPLNPEHVVDKEYTATKLSSILGEETYEYILKRLNSTSKQVEFGTVGKNLTELTKLAIEELGLPGISFIETMKRYYPNGNFASYIVGYAKQYSRINLKINEEYDLNKLYKNYFVNYDNITLTIENDNIVSLNDRKVKGIKKGISLLYIKTNGLPLVTLVINVTDYDSYNVVDNTIVGELGIESKYENTLQGVDGYIIYQQDKYGYKIPDTNEEKKDSVDGYDIYLTLDSNIQRFAESAVSEINEKYSPEFSIISVMDAENGEILASATTPSFNPNSLSSDMTYQNPLISYQYEPGSVMKIYTYMCAIETGLYEGDKMYLSGKYEFDGGIFIHDWDKKGWGELSYDTGFSYSSNVAIINIIKDYLSLSKLKNCLQNYGFGKKTGIELSNEETGDLEFNYETELMSAGFGQGISTTPIQQLQALTIIANDGVMIKPHIIKKIVNKKNNEEEISKVIKSEKLVKISTVNKIKDLMESVITESSPTGSKYYIEGYDLIGKTGTAQIFENGKYLTGSTDNILSIALMYPKDDPQIIIYAAAKKANSSSSSVLADSIKKLVKNISKYKNVYDINEQSEDVSLNVIGNYINKKVSKAKEELEKDNIDVIILGSGNKIIDQYPKAGTKVIIKDKVFLKTNSFDIKTPNLLKWSKTDVMKFCELSNITCKFEGYGYVTSQNINEGTKINKDLILELKLESTK